MERIKTATKAADLFGAGKHGFKNGNKAAAIAATDLEASFLNHMQEEFCNVIESRGIAVDGSRKNMMLEALQDMIDGAKTDYTARFTTTANINLTGLATQAGGDWAAPLTAADIVMAKDQTTASENGWYVAAAGAWARLGVADSDGEIKPSCLTRVSEGATLADTLWMLTTDAPIGVDTSDLVFEEQGQADVATVANDPTFADNSEKAASTGWIRRAMTAIAIADGFSISLTTNGYIRFPDWLGNFVMQWGRVPHGTGSQAVLVDGTFPISYGTQALSLSVMNLKTPNDGLFFTGLTLTQTGFTGYLYDVSLGPVATGDALYFSVGF